MLQLRCKRANAFIPSSKRPSWWHYGQNKQKEAQYYRKFNELVLTLKLVFVLQPRQLLELGTLALMCSVPMFQIFTKVYENETFWRQLAAATELPMSGLSNSMWVTMKPKRNKYSTSQISMMANLVGPFTHHPCEGHANLLHRSNNIDLSGETNLIATWSKTLFKLEKGHQSKLQSNERLISCICYLDWKRYTPKLKSTHRVTLMWWTESLDAQNDRNLHTFF